QAYPGQSGHRFDLSSAHPEHCRPDFQVLQLRITSRGELSDAGYLIGAPLEFHLDCLATRPVTRMVMSFGIHRAGRGLIAGPHTQRCGAQLPDSVQGRFTIRCAVSDLLLTPGEYTISIGAKSGGGLLYVLENAGALTI